MKGLSKAVLLLIILLTLNFCGGEQQSEPVTPQNQETTAAADTSTDEPEEMVEETEEIKEVTAPPKIKDIKFPEAPVAGKDFLVAVELEEEDPDVELQYRWFVNSKEVPDSSEDTLSSDYFGGNDWIQCWVMAQKGEKKSSLTKSKFIRAKGSVPVIKVTRLEELTIPGTLRYQIEAFDPSVGENIDSEANEMKYELLAPKEEGIQLNEQTGELSWELDEEKIKKLGTKVEIKFQVSSKHSQVVTSSIVLNFRKEAPKQGNTGEEEKKENRPERP